jgi:hypothetical protein
MGRSLRVATYPRPNADLFSIQATAFTKCMSMLFNRLTWVSELLNSICSDSNATTAYLEVSQLVSVLSIRDDPQPITQVVLLQILLGEVLQIAEQNTGGVTAGLY